jgi:hypothetical protein
MVSKQEFAELVPKKRRISLYGMTEAEIQTLGSVNQLGQVFYNMTYLFAGAFLGNLYNLFHAWNDPVAHVIGWTVLILAIVFGVSSWIITRHSGKITRSIKGLKK